MDILLYAASAMTVFLCVAQLVLFPHRRHHHSHDSRGTKTHTHRSHARRRMLALAAAVINMILVVLGVAAAVLAAIFAKREAMAAGGDLELWIWDTFSLWMEVAGGFCLLAGGLCLAAAAIRHKMRTARTLVQAAAAALIALLGVAYSVMCIAKGVHVDAWVLLFGAGCAAAVSGGNVMDLRRLSRGSSHHSGHSGHRTHGDHGDKDKNPTV